MENQHEKIQGYRDLSQVEIDTMNRIKDLEAQISGLHIEIAGRSPVDIPGLPPPDVRAMAIAQTKLQEGFMWFVRAVAKPQSGWEVP